jgi:hypothetical protein
MKKPSEQGSDLAAVFLLGLTKPVQQTSCLKRPTILGLLIVEPEEQSVEGPFKSKDPCSRSLQICI